ncbi:MAG: enoyl-CoA hydratase [Betaproteobacteria bacterium SG8_39]|nr:MAG: enoyl-CoA hydratase [Betaproteobacteria bacterium SG8_39]
MNIGYEIHDRTAVVTIDRPARRNAVDVDTQSELYAAFERFDADEALDVAILTGAGGHFCAGADLRAMAEGKRKTYDAEGSMGPMGPTRMRLTKPVIAAIEGYAVAGGAELALWCDLRVMAEGSTFGIFCRRFGVPLIDLGTVRLPRLIGHSRAMDLILTGRAVGAEEAERIGLANRLAPKGGALKVALELGASLSKFPQRCLRNDRRSALEQWGLQERDAMLNEFRIGLDTIASGESTAGAERFADGEGRGGRFD